MPTIPLLFTFDDAYALPAAVAFDSLLRHADKAHHYALHVLHLGLSSAHQARLLRVLEPHPHGSLHFHDCSQEAFPQAVAVGKSHFSKEIYFKLTAADRFPQYDRMLCSDVDVIFLGDVSLTYFADISDDCCYAGVDTILPTQRMQHYRGFSQTEMACLAGEIAAGYMLFNLKAMRAVGLQQVLTDYYVAHYEQLIFPEQDCLAICGGHRSEVLPWHHMVLNTYYKVDPTSCDFYEHTRLVFADVTEQRKAFQRALEHPIQLHYVGANKPWNAFRVARQQLWFAALRQIRGGGEWYLRTFPYVVMRKIKQYRLRRFLRKQLVKLKKYIP